MKLIAHIREGEEQTLYEHSMQTAHYASFSLEKTGFYNMAYLAGLLHDMGKATQKFNAYIEDAASGKDVLRGSVNHTFAGVIYLMERFHGDEKTAMSRLTAEIISYAIGAHHGLFDAVDLNGINGFVHRLDKDRDEICYEEAVKNYFEQVADVETIDSLFDEAAEEFSQFYQRLCVDWNKSKEKIFFFIGLLARLVLSAVIYGDRRDTREFMSGERTESEEYSAWKEQLEYLENCLNSFDTSSQINCVRQSISDQCEAFSDNPCGIYRLNVPTGGGKTLSSLRYALAHAEKYGKKRIIFIIPLLSVLDQNAKVIREYLKDSSIVTEHHSNVIREHENGENVGELDIYETVTDNWTSPVIISTLVQLLNIFIQIRHRMQGG